MSCEEFKEPGELVDGECPIHERPVEILQDDNYRTRGRMAAVPRAVRTGRPGSARR